MVSRNTVIQTTLPCPPVQQEEIDQLIHGLLNSCAAPGRPFTEIINLEKLLFICHKMVDLLRECSTLEYIHDPEGVAIFGDLHGSVFDLFKGLKNSGWPSERTLIFLGDYVDRGEYPIELVLFLFLLKLRYPKRVYLLRGNHETISQCYGNKTDERGLIRTIERYYPHVDGNLILFNINFVFDHLPLAAILSDQILLCHGGISQFVHSREDIARIPRPLTWLAPDINLLHISIMTDILWADPTRTHTSKYAPSDRGASYLFNRRALKENLRRLNCRALIRGHEANTSGFVEVFSGLCYTVHSSPAAFDEYYVAAVLLLDFDNTTNLLEGRTTYHIARGSIENVRADLITKFEEIRHLYPLDPPDPEAPPCWSCTKFMEGVAHAVFKWQRCLSHADYYNVMREYQTDERILFEEGFFEDMDRLARSDLRHLYTEAAQRFPAFLNQLIEENCLPSGAEQARADERPNYEFEFSLPQSDSRWPFLEIHD